MKIMFVIPRMNSGGAERVVANLSNYLCKNNDVRIVPIVSNESFYELDKRVKLCGQPLSINRKNIFTTLSCYVKYFMGAKKHIKKNLEEFKPDCVISFLVEADYLTYSVIKRKKNIVKVFSERNDPTRRSLAKRLILKRVYKTADLFVCQSKKVYDYYSYIQKEKKIVIPNPLDEKALPKPILNEQNHDIVSIGRLCRQKNYEMLVKSFISISDKLPSDSHLIIYGDGPMRGTIQQLIDENGMSNKIKLAGRKKQVLDAVKDCALFVLSSDYEGFPNVLLEAMAMGLPVISTDFYTGTAAELVKRKNGMLVPVGDEKKLADAMLVLMSDEKRRREMRKANISVRDEYNIEKINGLWMKAIMKGFSDGK